MFYDGGPLRSHSRIGEPAAVAKLSAAARPPGRDRRPLAPAGRVEGGAGGWSRPLVSDGHEAVLAPPLTADAVMRHEQIVRIVTSLDLQQSLVIVPKGTSLPRRIGKSGLRDVR